MTSIWAQLLLQVVLIALNAVFACAEIAVLSVNEAKIAKLEEAGNSKAKKLRQLTEQPSKFLSTIQVAITLSGFLGSAFAAENFAARLVDWVVGLGVSVNEKVLNTIAVILITLILSYFTLVFGELLPKRVAMKKSEQLSLAMAPMLCAVAGLFRPVVWLLSVSTNGALRLIGIDPNEEDEDVSEEEIRLLTDEAGEKGVIDAQEKEMIQNVFEFDDLTVSEFSTHRTDIDILWLEEDQESWNKTIQETRHSHYPICSDTIDNVVGVLSMKEYFRLPPDADRQTILDKAMKRAHFVSEGTHADVLFRQMKAERHHFAVVLDEYGGMSGIVTMNDLLEQLVGHFNEEDKHEEEEPEIRKIAEDTWEIRGSAPFDDIAQALRLELDDTDFDTFGGYIFSSYGMVPEDGSEFELDLPPLHVHVTEIKDHRIGKMTVIRTPDPVEEEESGKKDRDKDKDEL